MKNVIIIGPPASGKLTIAKALSKIKGYFLFDNHKSIDAVRILTANQEVFPNGLCHAIRKSIFLAAKSTQTPTVFTMVYGHPIDDDIMREYSDILTNSSPPLIVQLHCTKEDSIQRCQSSSRSGTTKITDPNGIEDLYSNFDIETDYMPASENMLHINTSIYSVDDSVQAILRKI